jgi:hypothetical protein
MRAKMSKRYGIGKHTLAVATELVLSTSTVLSVNSVEGWFAPQSASRLCRNQGGKSCRALEGTLG